MTTDTVSLDFLATQAKLNMEEMRLVRKDLADMMRLFNATYEMSRRNERRHGERRDDIELMIKMELGGSLSNIQTTIEVSLARVEETVADVARRIENLESSS